LKFMDDKEIKKVKRRLMEISEIENGLKSVKNRLIQANLRLVINIAKKIPQQGPLLSRSHPGRKHGAHEGGGKVRLPERLQIFHLFDMVDTPGHYTGDSRLCSDNKGARPRP